MHHRTGTVSPRNSTPDGTSSYTFLRTKVPNYERLSGQQRGPLVTFPEGLCSRKPRHKQRESIEHSRRIALYRVQHSGNTIEIVRVVEPFIVATNASIEANDRLQGGEG